MTKILNTILIICVIGFIISFSSFMYFTYLLYEGEQERDMCKTQFEDIMSSVPYRHIYCFANDDMLTINFGRNIDCVCYAWGDNYKSIDLTFPLGVTE